MVIGDMKDEGTIFSQINQLNVTTTEDWKKLFKDIWWPDTVTDENLDRLAELYPDDPTQGSPFDTGHLNALTPQYKRIAALTGDSTFESQRRFANEVASHTHKQWSYQIEIDLPVLSSLPISFHISDVVLHAFGTIPPELSKKSLHIMSCLVAFVHDLDPNGHGIPGLPQWPQYKWGEPAIGQEQLFHFTEPKVDLIPDGFRREAMQYLNDNPESFLF
jgi:acetylcholinesterase